MRRAMRATRSSRYARERSPRFTCACALLATATILAPSSVALAQSATDPVPDAVESYTRGSGSGAGYGIEYFPGNVLGLPDSSARTDIATIDPRQVLGLGLGGEIVLRFDRRIIVDRPGPDFTVFENAFAYTIGGRDRIYAEPGAVAVSRDGSHFVEFPFDSLTLEGCAGATPTNGPADPTDPEVSGGDSFDLALLGIDSVRYVRIRDVTAIVKNNREHPFWDMTLNGFDLDAVVAVHQIGASPSSVAEARNGAGCEAMIYPSPVASAATIRVSLDRRAELRVRLLDPLGREARSVADAPFEAGEHHLPLDATAMPAGLYMMTIEVDGRQAGLIKVPVTR